MCKFCHEDWNQRHTVQAKTDGVFSSYGGMQVENGCISVNVGGSVARFPVNRCPICGRKLEEKPRIPKSEYKVDDFVAPWNEPVNNTDENVVNETSASGPKATLIKTDGYSISVTEFESEKAAYKEMEKQYREVYDKVNSEFIDQCCLDQRDAIAYFNGEDVFVWKILILESKSCVESTYTAFLYEADGETSKNLSTFDEKEDAIEYAKFHEWDEVVEDATGTVVWKI